LEFVENNLLGRLRGEANNRYRNDDPANRDPRLVRRSLIRHRKQIERMLVQDAVLGFHPEQQ
jgi:hypothetical protein